MLGLVHDSQLKGTILRTEFKALLRNSLPFSALWHIFDQDIPEDEELVSIETINHIISSEKFQKTLPEPFYGRSRLQNTNLVKVAVYLVANRLLSSVLVRQGLSVFTTYEKISGFRRFEANVQVVGKALRSMSMVLGERRVQVWLEGTDRDMSCFWLHTSSSSCFATPAVSQPLSTPSLLWNSTSACAATSSPSTPAPKSTPTLFSVLSLSSNRVSTPVSKSSACQ